jgi:hypothetical protein
MKLALLIIGIVIVMYFWIKSYRTDIIRDKGLEALITGELKVYLITAYKNGKIFGYWNMAWDEFQSMEIMESELTEDGVDFSDIEVREIKALNFNDILEENRIPHNVKKSTLYGDQLMITSFVNVMNQKQKLIERV